MGARRLAWPAWLPLLLAALAYPLLPGHALAPLPGLPLDEPSVVALALVGLLFFGWAPRRPARWDRPLVGALVALSIVRVGTHAAGLDYGLRAEYFAVGPTGQLETRPERSFDYPLLDTTRLDRGLEFDDRNIPVAFWNDLRFNSSEPGYRFNMPLRAHWSGYLYAPRAGDYGLRLTARSPAQLTVDGARLAVDGPASQSAVLSLAQGSHRLEADYLRTAGAAVLMRVDWDPGPGLAPLAAPYLLGSPASPGRWAVAQVADSVAVGLAAAYAALLIVLAVRLVGYGWAQRTARMVAAWARRRRESGGSATASGTVPLERPLLALVLLAGLLWSVGQAWPFGQAVWVFNADEDWLTFESNARDIGLYSPLQLRGAAVGAAQPFSEQPLYSYILAGVHLLTGDSLYATITVQLALLPLEGVLLYVLARRLFGSAAGLAAAALFVPIAATDFRRTATVLLSENLVQVLLPVAALVLLSVVSRPAVGRAMAGGVLLGLVVLTRYTALLYVPVALAAVGRELFGRVGHARATALVLIAAGAATAIIALVPLRNAVAAGVPLWVPISGGQNLFYDRRLPASFDPGQIESGPLAPVYRLVGVGPDSQGVVALEWLRQDPADYLGWSLRFLGYALGLAELNPGTPARRELLPAVGFYAVAWLAWRETARARCWLVHGFVLTHLAVLAVFGINAYPPRLVLPMYALMPAVSGFGVVVAARWVVRAMRRGRSGASGLSVDARRSR